MLSAYPLQARVLVFAYWLTYNILKSRKPKFQPLEEASEAAPGVHATVAAHRQNVHALGHGILL